MSRALIAPFLLACSLVPQDGLRTSRSAESHGLLPRVRRDEGPRDRHARGREGRPLDGGTVREDRASESLAGRVPSGFKTGENALQGFNVIGMIEGASEEFVALCCHHDHVGLRNGKICNGANDNASGCAVLLDVARACAALKEEAEALAVVLLLRRRGADALGLPLLRPLGLVDMSKVVALICMDMMGGNFFPRDTESLYALGAENSPEILEAWKKVPKIEGLDVRPMGIELTEPLGDIAARATTAASASRRCRSSSSRAASPGRIISPRTTSSG
jgi:hypothetical protein